MAHSREELMERIVRSSRYLPTDKLAQVLDFVSALGARGDDPDAIERGSPEAILSALEGFRFEPGEIERLMTEIDEARHADLIDDDRLSA